MNCGAHKHWSNVYSKIPGTESFIVPISPGFRTHCQKSPRGIAILFVGPKINDPIQVLSHEASKPDGVDQNTRFADSTEWRSIWLYNPLGSRTGTNSPVFALAANCETVKIAKPSLVVHDQRKWALNEKTSEGSSGPTSCGALAEKKAFLYAILATVMPSSWAIRYFRTKQTSQYAKEIARHNKKTCSSIRSPEKSHKSLLHIRYTRDQVP